MTYYGAKELAASFRTVRKNTIQIAEEIPESKFDFRAAPDTRTVAQTLTHIAVTPRIQLHVQRNKIDDLRKISFPTPKCPANELASLDTPSIRSPSDTMA